MNDSAVGAPAEFFHNTDKVAERAPAMHNDREIEFFGDYELPGKDLFLELERLVGYFSIKSDFTNGNRPLAAGVFQLFERGQLVFSDISGMDTQGKRNGLVCCRNLP